MVRDWEAIFNTWTKPSSDTESEKQANAERMIRDAISNSTALKALNIKIVPQGSYRNNTNVRQESDVDICVCCMNPFFADYQFAEYGDAETGNTNAGYTYAEFKNDVQSALVKQFGAAGVYRGDKAFDVHANNYRVDADVIAAMAHRRYQKRTFNPFLGVNTPAEYTKPEGTQFVSDAGKTVINWPEQHYANGVAKNKRTGYRFKSVVRTLKNLKYEMEANGSAEQKKAAKEAPSYLIECLAYNAPDTVFGGISFRTTAREVIINCYNGTKTDDACKDWVEVNGMKWLFRGAQPWSRAQANTFLLEGWRHAEFS